VVNIRSKPVAFETASASRSGRPFRLKYHFSISGRRRSLVGRLQRRAENNLQALSVEARSDVRASRARVTTARAVVEEYAKVMVPMRENIVKLSQQQYDAMLLGVYQLIQAKQNEFRSLSGIHRGASRLLDRAK